MVAWQNDFKNKTTCLNYIRSPRTETSTKSYWSWMTNYFSGSYENYKIIFIIILFYKKKHTYKLSAISPKVPKTVLGFRHGRFSWLETVAENFSATGWQRNRIEPVDFCPRLFRPKGPAEIYAKKHIFFPYNLIFFLLQY